MSFVFFVFVLSTFVSGCTTVTEQDLADLQSPNAIVAKEAVERISRGPGFPLNLMGPLARRENEEKAVSIMVEVLRQGHGAKDVKLSILKALGDLGKRTEVPAAPLIEKLKHKDPHVRHCAIEALGKTKSKEALPTLVKLLEQQTDRYPVIWALGEIGDYGAIPYLDQLLAGEDKYVTYNAYRALAKIGTSKENHGGRPVAAASAVALQPSHTESSRRRAENVAVRHPLSPVDRPGSGKSPRGTSDHRALASQGSQATKKQTRQAASAPRGQTQERQQPQQGLATKPRLGKGTTIVEQGALKSQGSQATKKQADQAPPPRKHAKQETKKPEQGLATRTNPGKGTTIVGQSALKSQGSQVTKKHTNQALPAPKEETQERQKPQQGLATKPKLEKGTALYSEALALQRQGALQEAKKLYKDALQVSPNLVWALNNIGVIYMKEKNYGAAHSALEKAAKIGPNHVDPYYNLACLYALQKNESQSLSYLKKAVSVDEAARTWARTDGDLEHLHGHAEYQKIVREIKSPGGDQDQTASTKDSLSIK
jgi:tetratricopeptide (TPR) repeat protein